MTKRGRAAAVVEQLTALYPEALCSLVYDVDWQLLFATRLSAQCTDARVNQITPLLFGAFGSLEALAEADLAAVEDIVRPCGYYRAKAHDIVLCARALLERHGGRVPDTMEALLALPGVGRKTANLILGDLYKQPAIVADTHCIRISNRLGLANSADPAKVEVQLKALIAPVEQSDFCHRLVFFGRDVCRARSPQCGGCPLLPLCPTGK